MLANVGDLYAPPHRFFPFEGPRWLMTTEPLGETMSVVEGVPFDVLMIYVELALFYHHPNAAEIAQVDDDTPMQFALVEGEYAMMLSYRFDQGVWGDGSWQAVLQSAQCGLPETGLDKHIGVWIPLIDADTGVLRTYRLTTWPGVFVTAVRRAMAVQLDNLGRHGAAVTEARGVAEIQHWVGLHPTPAELVDAEATLIIQGGKDAKIIREGKP